MRVLILMLIIASTLTFCGQNFNEKALTKFFQQEKYDIAIIQNLPLYDSLKNIIITNFDTIYKLANSKHLVYHAEKDSSIQEDASFYIFEVSNSSTNYLKNQLPEDIYLGIEKIIGKIGTDYIQAFIVHADSTVEIRAKFFYADKGSADIGHVLNWRKSGLQTKSTDRFYRDTLLTPNWSYSIWAEPRQGF